MRSSSRRSHVIQHPTVILHESKSEGLILPDQLRSTDVRWIWIIKPNLFSPTRLTSLWTHLRASDGCCNMFLMTLTSGMMSLVSLVFDLWSLWPLQQVKSSNSQENTNIITNITRCFSPSCAPLRFISQLLRRSRTTVWEPPTCANRMKQFENQHSVKLHKHMKYSIYL